MDTTEPTLASINADLSASLEGMLEDTLTQPVAGTSTVRELMNLLGQRQDHDRLDAALHTLITRATTDPQARTLLLHAMIPGLCNIARRTPTEDRAETYSIVIECFYDALEHEPIRRKTTKVAARLLGEVRTRYSTHRAEQQALADAERLFTNRALGSRYLPLFAHQTQTPVTAHDNQLNLLEALAWARDRDIVTLDEVRFLLAVYSPDTGLTLDELGLGDLAPAAIRKRASRITQRLATAVASDRDTLQDLLDHTTAR